MSIRVNLRTQMRKKKLRNLTDLSFESGIPLRKLEGLVESDSLEEKHYKVLDELKEFFGCRLLSLMIRKPLFNFDGNSYDGISGIVYFIRNKNNNLTKIGYTRDLAHRLMCLKWECGDVELLHYISTYDARVLENTFHSLFEDKRVIKEWFNLNELDLEKIKKA